jgi:NAD-dependent dihydropyrimidine dehydrogenase PreA subunit
MKTVYERYRIKTSEAPSRTRFPSRYTVKRFNNCTNVQECTQACVYEVHKVREDGEMADPDQDLCRGCYLCTLTCPKGAISIGVNPEFEKLGNSYFTPDRIKTINFEAENGRVPVSGTGYKGMFAGKGLDSMWFDFSEIVRPTRDGIHGREYISTSVDLGRNLPWLEFSGDGRLLSDTPRSVEIPVPMILDRPLGSEGNKNLQLALAKASTKLNTFAIISVKQFTGDLTPYGSSIIPRIEGDQIEEFQDLVKASRIVELDLMEVQRKHEIELARSKNPLVLISVRLSYNEKSCETAENLVKGGVDIIHLDLDEQEVEQEPDIVRKAIQSVHSHLVLKNIRDQVTLISGGGIAEAAHVPKSIILGADAVAVGPAYQVALGCKVCRGDKHREDCPLNMKEEDTEWAAQRITNMVSSWRDQILEVLGGMGLREIRRQRGEIGRAMFHEDLEAKIFGDSQ